MINHFNHLIENTLNPLREATNEELINKINELSESIREIQIKLNLYMRV